MTTLDLPSLEERLTIDTSEGKPVILLRAAHGALLRISESTRQLLLHRSRGVSFEEMAEALRRSGKTITGDELEAAYNKVIAKIRAIELRAGRSKGGFLFRLPMVPSRWVRRLALLFAPAFHPVAAGVLILWILVTAAWMAPSLAEMKVRDFWPSYGLFLISLFFHELGHASACARYGGSPSDIGVTAYLIYPSFYCDVTSAWSLGRWQRVVVDVGGVYFQLIFGAACAIVHGISGWAPAKGVLVFIAGSCLFSLNPILKLDGYWVIADALGVTDLAGTPLRIGRQLWALLQKKAPPPLPWPLWVSGALGGYSVLACAFWAGFFYKLGPQIAGSFSDFREAAIAIGRHLREEPGWPEPESIQAFAMSLFLLALPVVMAGRLLRGVVLAGRRKLGERRRPLAG